MSITTANAHPTADDRIGTDAFPATDRNPSFHTLHVGGLTIFVADDAEGVEIADKLAVAATYLAKQVRASVMGASS